MAALLQPTAYFDCFVCAYPAADPERYQCHNR